MASTVKMKKILIIILAILNLSKRKHKIKDLLKIIVRGTATVEIKQMFNYIL